MSRPENGVREYGSGIVLKRKRNLDLDRVLDELHAKKRWLDTVIEALEKAIQSPDYQLLECIANAFANGNQSGPKVDLGPPQRARLTRLASEVQKSGGRRRKKRDLVELVH